MSRRRSTHEWTVKDQATLVFALTCVAVGISGLLVLGIYWSAGLLP